MTPSLSPLVLSYVVPYLLGRGAGVKITDNPLIVLTYILYFLERAVKRPRTLTLILALGLTLFPRATRMDSMGQSAWEAMGGRDSFERLLHNSKLQAQLRLLHLTLTLNMPFLLTPFFPFVISSRMTFSRSSSPRNPNP